MNNRPQTSCRPASCLASCLASCPLSRYDRPTGPAGRRRGFTLIEVLVVIAIIAVLAGMLFVGGKMISNHSRAKATRVTLSNLKAMYAEMENARGVKFYEAVQVNGVAIYAPVNGSPASIAAPADVTADAYLGNKPDRHGQAVQGTGSIMAMVQMIPTTKDMISRLPVNQLLPDSSAPGAESHSARADPPVLLDGWGNPIIFVPPGGLTYVYRTTNGSYQQSIIIAPDNKAFFASAGPDGNFTKGDDNIYSFED